MRIASSRRAELLHPRSMGLASRQALIAYIFLTPALIYFALFFFFPIGLEFWASLHSGQPLIGPSTFVGIENYMRALQDPRVLNSFWVTVQFAVGVTIITIVFSLGLALLLHQKLPGRVVLRAIFLFPYMTSFVILALMWRNILDPYTGLFNGLLTMLGLPNQNWLTDYRSALLAVIVITVLHQIGYNMILFLAGLQGIPDMYYEAATIDGAGPASRFWHITLPLLAPTTLFVSVISVIGSLQAFAQAYILTRGGPADATRFYVFHVFHVAFSELQIGYASALAFLMFFVTLVLTMVQLRLGRREIEY